MILAYRYIRDKRRAAKAAREAEAAGLPPPSQQERDADSQGTAHDESPVSGAAPHGKISSSTKWKLMLMLALLVPVFFETLDYTGKQLAQQILCLDYNLSSKVVATAQVHIAVRLALFIRSRQR